MAVSYPPDDFERLTHKFRSRALSPPASKVDVLIDLEYLGDVRIVGVLLQVLANPLEDDEVRIHALEWLRCRQCTTTDRQGIAGAICEIASKNTNPAVRLHAVLALAGFADVEEVQATLGGITLDANESIDIRYCAFTSLEKAGLTPHCKDVLRQLSADTALGPCARHAMSLWRST